MRLLVIPIFLGVAMVSWAYELPRGSMWCVWYTLAVFELGAFVQALASEEPNRKARGEAYERGRFDAIKEVKNGQATQVR